MQVPVELLYVISVVVPIAFMLLRTLWVKFLSVHSVKNNQNISGTQTSIWTGLRDNIVGWLFTFVLTGTITQVIKQTVGRPRPNNFALAIFSTYTGEDAMINQSFESFPSGHSSMSMSSMFYISLIMLHDITETPDRGCWNDPIHALYIRGAYVVRAMLPIFLSLYVGCTRIIDYWHHPSDVLTGWSLGILCAVFGYYHVRNSQGLRGLYIEVLKGKNY